MLTCNPPGKLWFGLQDCLGKLSLVQLSSPQCLSVVGLSLQWGSTVATLTLLLFHWTTPVYMSSDLLFPSLYFKALKYTVKASKKIEKAKDKKGKLYEKGYCWFLNCLCLASQFSWILMSLSITAHECSNSTWLFVVCRMVLNKFKAMLV
jgi:hypothetical protein